MSNSPSTAVKTRTTRWRPTVYAIPILTIHLLSLAALLPVCFSWAGVVALILGIYFFGQGINLGYHRLLTHRSLKVPKWIERTYVIMALCCLEETPAKWVSTHRLHHAHSDDEFDPHSPTRTFFWAHMGWLLRDVPDQNQLAVHIKFASDLLKDRFYRYLEKAWWFALVLFVVQLGVYFGLGVLLASTGLISGIEPWRLGLSLVVWGVLLRLVMVWHITWSVNSFAHVFGYRNYGTKENSRNNWLVGLVASGEGWHNNHHHDPSSASVQHRWWEFDFTYYQILALEKMGLATEVVRPRHIRQKQRAEKSESAQLARENQDDSAPANDEQLTNSSETSSLDSNGSKVQQAETAGSSTESK